MIPELTAADSLIRIPPGVDVPITARVRALIDTAEFRRLSAVSQLGLVSLVYPGATHTRFEHSLGVYQAALEFLRQLSQDERFTSVVAPADAELFLAAALLHDLGHWPYCHPIEDLSLTGVPDHEHFANSFLLEGEVADVLRHEWGVNPREVVTLLSGKPTTPQAKILSSLLSGPIDVDKIDYLHRDSLHAGVPYGQHFDRSRLVKSLCLNAAGDGLAITDKGKTAAEMMVFARYVMFSEVYWHHAVRSATAMLQRAFYLTHHQLEIDSFFRLTDGTFVEQWRKVAGVGPAKELLEGLFGASRRLYKRVAQFSVFEDAEFYGRLTRRPYGWLANLAEHFATVLSRAVGRVIAPHEILFDAPPVQLEVEFDIEVYFAKQHTYQRLGEISPMVHTLARQQFDDYVKRVRIFAHPRVIDDVRGLANLKELLSEAILRTG